jgi:hypothetical protein
MSIDLSRVGVSGPLSARAPFFPAAVSPLAPPPTIGGLRRLLQAGRRPHASEAFGTSPRTNTTVPGDAFRLIASISDGAPQWSWAKTVKATVAMTAVVATMLTVMIQNSRFV